MPITYTRSFPERPSHLHASDVDNSIVLSDIVRSGEVSRLRRRGAIAIRDVPAPQSPVQLPLATPPPSTSSGTSSHPFTAQPRPEPDLSETDDDDAEQRQRGVGRWFFRSRLNSRELSTSDFNDPDPLLLSPESEIRPEDEDEDSSYVLFCGGRLREGDWYASPPDLPQPPNPPARHRASAFRPQPPARRPPYTRARRTNGCGMLIHLNAQPRRRQGTWVACGAAAEAVVRMDPRYFECRAAVKMIKSACGCVREGVGCRVCGNPLGMIYVPCQAAADGLNIPRASSSSSSSSSSSASTSTSRTQPVQSGSHMHPPGPNYWLPSMDSCQRRRNSPTAEIFNFFSERVRSAPEFAFPPPPSPDALPSRPTQPSLPWAFAIPPQRLSGSSIPESFAYRQGTDRFSMPSVDNIQTLDSLFDGRPGDVSRNGADSPLEEETEGDNAEKPDDSGPGGSDQIPWAER